MCGILTLERTIEVCGPSFFFNISGMINEAIAQSGFQEGYVTIQTRHTTTGFIGTGLLVQEDEPLLMKDLEEVFEVIDPKGKRHKHDNFTIRTVNIGPNERVNAGAHIRASFLQTSITLIFTGGLLALGKWQSVLFIDFDSDGRPPRHIIIQVRGK